MGRGQSPGRAARQLCVLSRLRRVEDKQVGEPNDLSDKGGAELDRAVTAALYLVAQRFEVAHEKRSRRAGDEFTGLALKINGAKSLPEFRAGEPEPR